MKYAEIDKNKVKQICNAMREKVNGHIIRNCDKCPLRRTIEPTGKTGFCWYRLNDIYKGYEKEHKRWQKEEVCHPEELKAWLLETEE